jgi:hypothetical protein
LPRTSCLSGRGGHHGILSSTAFLAAAPLNGVVRRQETTAMSLDYTCYALTKRALSPQKIAESSPDWIIEFVDADSGKPLHKSRALPSYCVVWGCPRSARLDLAALAGNGDSLNDLERRGQLGSCALEIETDFVADPEFLADLPPRHRRVLAGARSRYDTSTSASCGGDLS